MHYSLSALSKNIKRTIEPKDSRNWNVIRQIVGLSVNDSQRIKKMYMRQ